MSLQWLNEHLPQGDFDGQISIDSNRKKTKDGALSEYQDKTCEEEASVKVQPYADADGNGKGYGEATHQDVSHGQRHQKIVGGVFQSGVDRDGPAHQDVARYGENSNYYFNRDVVRIHLSKVWWEDQKLQAVHGEDGHPQRCF